MSADTNKARDARFSNMLFLAIEFKKKKKNYGFFFSN